MRQVPTRYIVSLLIIILLASPVLAATGRVNITGIDRATAQANATISTAPNKITVTTWNVDNGIKTFWVDVSNAQDTITFTIGNISVNRVMELKVNSSSENVSQANSTGYVTFVRTQSTGNQTYDLRPATNVGGTNSTWGWFRDWIYVAGQNLSAVLGGYVPLTGTTSDLDMNNKNITNVHRMNVTTTNVTFLNATNISGNGSAISYFNLTNGTGALPAVSGAALTGMSLYTIINVTQNYTVANSSMTLFNVSAFTGTLNMTLPVMTGSGKIFTIMKTDASSSAVQINVTGNCCIDGVAWANITSQYESVDLVDINSMWKIT